MVERLDVENHTDNCVLRAHHIELCQDVIKSLKEEFGDFFLPWDKALQEFKSLARGYAVRELEAQSKMREYALKFSLRDNVPGDLDLYYYLCDLIGTTPQEKFTTLNKRVEFYEQLFETINRKEGRIIFVSRPDLYCSSCALGNHCKVKVDPDEDKDQFYLQHFEKYMRTNYGKRKRDLGMIGKTVEGDTFVTSELLFEPGFYRYFSKRLEKE